MRNMIRGGGVVFPERTKASAKDPGILSNSGMLVHKVGEKKHNYF